MSRRSRIAKKLLLTLPIPVLLLGGLGAGWARIADHREGVAEATRQYEAHQPQPVRELGSTKSLTITPLLDWHASRDDLQTDMGVSYLVETDDMTILFDLGNNSQGAAPSPLEHNMEALGVELDGVDAVVISHAHFDHVGGKRWTDGELSGTTFGIGNAQPDLGDKRVITPIEMTYPGSQPQVGFDPVRVGDGVATTGTIPRKLLIGWIDEQALVVNVEGKGLVLIVGCGHQTLPRLIERTEAVFEQPIYGVVGGLHYPVPEGRMNKLGLNFQRLVASGEGPLDPITQEDIEAELSLLDDRNVGLVGIGGHDSSDEVISMATQRFGDAYQRVEVGLPIVVR